MYIYVATNRYDDHTYTQLHNSHPGKKNSAYLVQIVTNNFSTAKLFQGNMHTCAYRRVKIKLVCML